VRDLDWRTLLAVSAGGTDPKLMIALAFREMAENAGKIGTLSVTPDLLSQLIAPQSIVSAPAIAAATGPERKGGKP
jgi:hypothetical protein